MSGFAQALERGKLAESKIAKWLRSKGWTVIPVYDIEMNQGKGPQIFTPLEEIVAPDLLVWKESRFRFIEAKNKTVFTWYRIGGVWQTGIDARHYREYLRAAEHFGLDLWLMFLHESAVPDAKDLAYASCPRECPTGLFGNSLRRLIDPAPREDSRWGRSGMVYWNKERLRRLCSLEELSVPSVSLDFEHGPLSGTQPPLFGPEAENA